MPKDSNRLDLNADLEKLSGDFLKDVEAATKEVKARKKADAEKDHRNAIRKKDKRTSMIIIAAATVVLILVAYWVVAAKEPTQPAMAVVAPQQANPAINTPSRSAATTRQSNAPRFAPAPANAQNQQSQNPPNEYDNEPM